MPGTEEVKLPEGRNPSGPEDFAPYTETKNVYWFNKLWKGFFWTIDGPVTWWREKVVIPNNKKTYYYHMRFLRTPTVDECYTDDIICLAEAEDQYKRDRKVETHILNILKNRFIDCLRYHGHFEADKCFYLREQFEAAELNWFIKYGDVNMYGNVTEAYYKQIHRMIWERRQAEKKARQEGNQDSQ